MTSPHVGINKLHFLLLALFVLLAVATVHADSNYAYGSPHGDDDDNDGGGDDSEATDGGYDPKYRSRDRYGRLNGDDNDDQDEEEGYKKPASKKADYHKSGYDKLTLKKHAPKDGYRKSEKDDDDDNSGGKYGYAKPEHGDDDDEDDNKHKRGYGKPSKGDSKHPGSYGKPKKDEKDDAIKYGNDKLEDNDEYDDGKVPKKDDKGRFHGGYNKPEKDDKHPKPTSFLLEVVPKSISVEGVISCQNCKYVGSDSLTDAKPIAGAKVKVVCQTGPRYKSFFYAIGISDSNGFFLISVPHFDFKKFVPVDDCVVSLVSSPFKECSTATDINMGKSGGPLRPIPTFAPSENLMFSVGAFAFAPKQCSSKTPPIYAP